MSDSTGHRLVLRTPLAPDECAARLQARTLSPWGLFVSGLMMRGQGDRPVYGSVSSRGFSLCLRIPYKNSFQTRAAGRFEADRSGSRVDVRFGMATSLKIFWAVGIAGLLAFLVVAGTSFVAGKGVPSLTFVWVPIAACGFMFVVMKYGRWLARDEERKLQEFLVRELEASIDSSREPIQ